MWTLRWILQEICVVLLWQGIVLVGNTDGIAVRASKSPLRNTGRATGGSSLEFTRRLKQGRLPEMLGRPGSAVHEWSLPDYVLYRWITDRKRREKPSFDQMSVTGNPDKVSRQVPMNIGDFDKTTSPTPVTTPASRCYYYGCSDANAGPPACYFTLNAIDIPKNVPCVCVCSTNGKPTDPTTPMADYGDSDYADYQAALNSRTPRRGNVSNSISVIVFLVIYVFVVVGYLKLTVKWY